METQVKTPQKGRARMQVSRTIKPACVEEPQTGTLVHGSLAINTYFEQWHEFLMLPKDYEVVGVYWDVWYQRWLLIIEHESFPIPEENELLPELDVHYSTSWDEKGERNTWISDINIRK